MANLGDVGRHTRLSRVCKKLFLPEPSRNHSIDDAANAAGKALSQVVKWSGTNMRSKPSTPFVIHIPDAATGQIYLLSKNGLPADIPRMASNDGVRFYDLDDGVYYAGSTSGLSVWKITIAGTSVTIEALTPPPTSDGGTPSSIWFG